jgi:hypothetical protein
MANESGGPEKSSDGAPMSGNDGTEDVAAMKARIDALEGELQAEKERESTLAMKTQSRAPRGLSVLSAVMIVVALVLAPLSVASVWADRIVSNTDQYVKTVEPLADNPDVQAALTDQVTQAILDNLDVVSVTQEALATLASRPNMPPAAAAAIPGLQGALVSGVENFVHDQVAKVIASPEFAQVWDQVNRAAHTEVVKLLSGDTSGAISASGDSVSLSLGPIIEQVKAALVAKGFTLANSIPTVDRSFVLMQSSSVTKAQTAFSFLNGIGIWLPIIAIALLVGGILLARDRRAALLRSGLGLAGAMIVLGAALAIGRTWYVDTTPGNVLTARAAGGVFDTLIRFLRQALRAVAFLGLVVAFIAWVSGPSGGALRLRRGFTQGIGSLRGSAESAGWQTGRVGTWTHVHRTALRITAFGLGGLVLVLWSQPTAWVVLFVALFVLLLLAVIEFLGRPAQEPQA